MRVNGRDVPWQSIGALCRAKAAQLGDRLFAEIAGRALSYAELLERSVSTARGLLALGLRPGDRVATLLHNTPEQIFVGFGCSLSGLVWVPINAGLRRDDLTYTLRDSGSRVLVCEAETRGQAEEIGPEMRERLAVFDIDEGGPFRPFATLTSGALDQRLPEVAGSDPAVILYTGGTTGLPKGVRLPQLSFVLAGIRYGETFDIRPGERHLTTLPLFHAGGLQWGIFGPLANDMTTVVERRFSATSYFSRVRETGANVIDPFGAMLTMLCRQPPDPRDRDHRVRIAVGAVHNLPPGIPEQFSERFGIPLVELYGLTEAGGAMITANRIDSAVPGTNGRAHGWAEIAIVDDEDLPVAQGDLGEIILRPTFPNMFMTAYHDAPEATAEAMRNFWLHTGDLGRLDADGVLTFVGRKAHWLRRRGENISAFEIEAAISGYHGIREVAVVGVPSELGEDEVKAFVVSEAGTSISPERLAVWLDERLAAFKVPRFIEVIDALPRSTTKQEIERAKLKVRDNSRAWDRLAEPGIAAE